MEFGMGLRQTAQGDTTRVRGETAYSPRRGSGPVYLNERCDKYSTTASDISRDFYRMPLVPMDDVFGPHTEMRRFPYS